MAANYTIEFDNGTKLHVHLKKEPVELTVELADRKTVDFKYDPSDELPSSITFDQTEPRQVSKHGSKWVNRVGSDSRWVQYESTNAEGTEHK